jgi:DNA-binding NarL/FixJ family response regulator
VYRTAKRTAHRLEDPGGREHLALNLSLDDLDGYRRDAIIGDTADTEGEYGLNLDLKRVEGRLKKMAKRDELEVYMMIRAGYHWYEIGERLGENPNTVYRRFRRMLQRISDFV